jgi:AraC family transcriptional regulator
VLLALILNADLPGAGDTLYREMMERAVAARFARVVHSPVYSAETVGDVRLRRALAYIHDRLGEDLSLSEMASQAAMSASQFARAFKAATGLSPLQYVIEQRLQQASVLLRTTRLTVAQICHRVSYGDVSRFGQHFKRHFGVTPAAARGG